MNGFVILLRNLPQHHPLPQGPPNYDPRAKSSPQRHFVNNEKVISLQELVDLVECNISRSKHIT